MRRVWEWRRTLVSAAALTFFVSCASQPPHRVVLQTDTDCATTYAGATWSEEANPNSEVPRLQKVIHAEDHDPHARGCWDTSVEHHADYDLYTVEFDDQGWLAGTSSEHAPDQTQLSLLMADLNKLTRGRGDPDARPLSVIVYTHGWHHTAAPDDSNVIAFRRLLARASVVERELCLARRRDGATALEEAPAETVR